MHYTHIKRSNNNKNNIRWKKHINFFLSLGIIDYTLIDEPHPTPMLCKVIRNTNSAKKTGTHHTHRIQQLNYFIFFSLFSEQMMPGIRCVAPIFNDIELVFAWQWFCLHRLYQLNSVIFPKAKEKHSYTRYVTFTS